MTHRRCLDGEQSQLIVRDTLRLWLNDCWVLGFSLSNAVTVAGRPESEHNKAHCITNSIMSRYTGFASRNLGESRERAPRQLTLVLPSNNPGTDITEEIAVVGTNKTSEKKSCFNSRMPIVSAHPSYMMLECYS